MVWGEPEEQLSGHTSKGTQLIEKRLQLINREENNITRAYLGKNLGTRVEFKIRLDE